MSAEAQVQLTNRAKKRRAFIGLGLSALFFADLFLHRGALVDPISPTLLLTGVGVGIAIGLVLSAFVAQSGTEAVEAVGGIRLILAIFALPIIAGFAGGYYARVAVELVHFSNYSPTHSEIQAEITDMDHGRRSGPYAFVRPYPGARELKVRVSNAVYNRLDPRRSPGRDCLILPIETGRNGVKRAILPNAFDNSLGMNRLVRCDSRATNSSS
jgi:hypothetical protein